MKKKIFSSMLLLAMVITTVGMFVSCKDYDDDINDLRNQISTNTASLQSMVTEQINTVNSQITSLQTQASNLQAAYEAADANLKSTLEVVITESISTSEAYADIQAAQAQSAAIAAAQEMVDGAIATLQAALDQANAAIAANGDNIATLISANADLEVAIQTAQARADEAYSYADKAYSLAQDAYNLAQDAYNQALSNAAALGDKADQTDLDALESTVTANRESVLLLEETVQEIYEFCAYDVQEALYELMEEIYEVYFQAIANASNIEAIQAQLGDLSSTDESLLEMINELESSLNATNDGLVERCAIIQAQVNDNASAIAAQEEEIAQLKVDIDAALATAKAYTDAEIAEVTEIMTALQDKIEELGGSVAILNGNIDDLSAELASLKEQLGIEDDAIWSQIVDLISQIGDVSDSVDALEIAYKYADAQLQAQIDNLSDEIETIKAEMTIKITALKEALEDLINGNVSDLEAKLNSTESNLLEEIQKAVEDLQNQISSTASGLQGQISSTEAGLQGQIDYLQTVIDDLQLQIDGNTQTLGEQIEYILNSLGLYAKLTDLDNYTTTADLEGYLDLIKGKIEAIDASLDLLTNINDFTELSDKVTEQGESIEALKEDIKTLNIYLAYANQRLKSLVFAPTTYVNGIEAIMFTTLEYYAWDDAEADGPKSTASSNYYVIDDENHYEEYLVNPKNVTMDGISDLSYISNTATNYDTHTRTVSTTAPITVSSSKIEDGVLKLTLAKNTKQGETFGTSNKDFTLVSLKATISKDLLTEDEQDEDIAVYSDWARLYEQTIRPYIHSTVEGIGEDASGNLTESGDAHYWNYSTMYEGKTPADEMTAGNDKYIAAEVVYTETLDLRTLVEVCDKDGNTYDMDKFHLDWEFNLMPYIIKNEGDTQDATDQANFAQLDGSIISATGRHGETESTRVAIGREPAIQVILRDTKNDKIVDVRYFKIKWVDEGQEPETIDFGPLGEFTDTYFAKDSYDCGRTISETVLEEAINSLCTLKNMTKAEFFDSSYGYTLNSDLYASYDDAANAKNPVSGLGTIEVLDDGQGSAQTYNIQWTIDLSDEAVAPTQKEYEAGSKTITAYGYFQSNTNPNGRIVFSVTVTVDITQMALAVKHNYAYINEAETDCYVNPQLDSDTKYGTSKYKTTMILSDLLKNYIDDGKQPTEIDDLVNYGDASIIFDSSKLSALASKTGTSASNWKVTDNGLTLQYNNNGTWETAATITEEGVIQLYEGETPGQDINTSVPTEGAKLLVGNYAPVKLYDESCKWTQDIESYNVNFLTPLKVDISNVETVELSDNTSGGSSSKEIDGTIEIVEAYTTNGRLVYSNASQETKDADLDYYADEKTLTPWYGVGTPEMGTAMINQNKDGIFESSCNTKITDLLRYDEDEGDYVQMYRVVVDTDNWIVTFYNNSGASLTHVLNIEIPFTISTKWQDGLKATIYVTINPFLNQN